MFIIPTPSDPIHSHTFPTGEFSVCPMLNSQFSGLCNLQDWKCPNHRHQQQDYQPDDGDYYDCSYFLNMIIISNYATIRISMMFFSLMMVNGYTMIYFDYDWV